LVFGKRLVGHRDEDGPTDLFLGELSRGHRHVRELREELLPQIQHAVAEPARSRGVPVEVLDRLRPLRHRAAAYDALPYAPHGIRSGQHMDFAVPQDYADLLSSFRSFLDREVRAVQERYAQALQDDVLSEEMRAGGLKLRRRSAELGLYGAYMPEAVGGQDLSALGHTL